MSPSLTPERSLVVKTVKASLVLNLRSSAFVYKPDKTLAISPNVKHVLNITILQYNKGIFEQRTWENECTKLLFYNKLLFLLIHTIPGMSSKSIIVKHPFQATYWLFYKYTWSNCTFLVSSDLQQMIPIPFLKKTNNFLVIFISLLFKLLPVH